MRWLFSFDGKIGRLAYGASAILVFLSQHLLVLALFQIGGKQPPIDFWFWALPLRASARLDTVFAGGVPLLYSILAYSLLVDWVLAALSFRRARNADISDVFGAVAIVPFVQIPAMFCLSIFRSRATERVTPPSLAEDASGGRSVVQGI